VIETVQRPPASRFEPVKRLEHEGGEAQDGRARKHVLVAGEEKAVEERLGRERPCRIERFVRAADVRGNPQSAAGMKQALHGFGRSKTSRG